jgi:pyridoxine kinase
MIAAIGENGRLGGIDAVFTGYLPSAEHVALAADLVERLRIKKPDLLYCCDPILGDEPDGLYIAESAAETLRAKLLPLADIVTPNRFELGWLAAREIASGADAVAAARTLGGIVLATSSPAGSESQLSNQLLADGRAWRAMVERREDVPHGTGDALAALFLGFILRSRTAPDALSLATGSLEAIIAASEGMEELNLIASQEAWAIPAPWPIAEVE